VIIENVIIKLNIKQLFIPMLKVGDNFSQYSLLRNAPVAPVSTLDLETFMYMNIADDKDAAIARYHMRTGMAANSQQSMMEALPSQSIRFVVVSNQNTNNTKMLSKQSTQGFERFHLQKN
jgi:hypothetical protein